MDRRRWLWWGKPRRWWHPRTYLDGLHRQREWRTFRRRDDPDAAWRCCEYWPRTLINKWNGREFAAKHGCRLPELYWRGAATDVPLERLPASLVIRPMQGYESLNVIAIAGGRDLLHDRSAAPSELRKVLRQRRRLNWGLPVMAEEFVQTPSREHGLPLEFKCHVFGDTVAAIEVHERTGPSPTVCRYYTSTWEPIESGMPGTPMRLIDAPDGLDELRRISLRISTAVGTYMRVDFFLANGGWVFNEFSSTPLDHRHYRPAFSERLTRLWQEKCPHAT
jgi:hypothetical protein